MKVCVTQHSYQYKGPHMIHICFALLLFTTTTHGLDPLRVRSDGHFVDPAGRVVLLHGFNVVVKQFPWYSEDMFNKTLLARYKGWGFNAVRLGNNNEFGQTDNLTFTAKYMSKLTSIFQALCGVGWSLTNRGSTMKHIWAL